MAEKLLQKPLMPRQGMKPDCAVVLIPASRKIAGQQVKLKVDPQRNTDVPVHNVLGVLRGADELLSKEAIIVSAHLDHIGLSSGGPDTINNGADDNATGVTAVVSMADAFTSLGAPPARSVIFCTFWGKRKGWLVPRDLWKDRCGRWKRSPQISTLKWWADRKRMLGRKPG